MSRKFFLGIVALLAVGATLGWLLHRLEAPPEGFRVTPAEIVKFKRSMGVVSPPFAAAPTPLSLTRTVRLAIGSLGFRDDEQNRQLADLIAAKLTHEQGLQLVERQQFDSVLREQELSLSGLVRAREAVRAGKLLKADWFLLGSTALINKTNCLVVRLVDARTGITRDGTVFVRTTDYALAEEVAEFVGTARQAAAEALPKVYLAFGTFEDLSFNDRLARFPIQLRAYLTAAYQHSRFTRLEREYADALLREMELDLAGLTHAAGTNAPMPLLSAFWLVDGCYQSYETSNLTVEISLDVHRIFSTATHVMVRGAPGEPVCQKVKSAVDGILNQSAGVVIPSRLSEARAQMAAGKQLSGRQDRLIYTFYQELDAEQAALQRHNLQEAIRAFDIVLLLEPTNREAKCYLAGCLRDQTIARTDEARNLYREILEQPIQDRWSDVAKRALVASFQWSSPQEKAHWFEQAINGNTNSDLQALYRQNADSAERDVAIAQGVADATRLAEQRWVEKIRSCQNFMEGTGGRFYGDYGFYEFRDAFPDKTTAARHMMEYLPKLEATFPELAPHLAAEVLSYQTDSNSPVMAEFQKQLEWCQAHPREILSPGLWSGCVREAFNWLYYHRHFARAIKTMEAWRAVTDLSSEDQIALAFAFMGDHQWKPALNIFESFSNTPVMMSTDRPWGPAWKPILTDQEADLCRKKLGHPARHDPKQFQMDATSVCLCTPSTFTVGDNGLWIGISDQLIHLDFNLKTNFEMTLPKNPSTPVTALLCEPSTLWIGTAGDGLIEFDKSRRRFQHFTVRDGLLMNGICGVHLAENALWIGYGNGTGGGLGVLNLATHRFTSFTASLSPEAGAELRPREGVAQIQTDPDGNVWFIAGSALWKSQPLRGVWQTEPQNNGVWVRSCAMDREQLVEGLAIARIELTLELTGARIGGTNEIQTVKRRVALEDASRSSTFLQTNGSSQQIIGMSSSDLPSKGRLVIHKLQDNQQQVLLDGLPAPPSALALEGRKLWVGGQGFIALVDLNDRKIKNITYVSASSVDKLQVGGGYIWAQYDWHLHRARLADLQ